MPSSLRRREGRLLRGANKKILSYSVETCGRVVRLGFRFNRSRPRSEKASKGAEKSCHKRRRKRGLRKGKSRSRGRHPRRSTPAATVPKGSMRGIMHHLRCCDFETRVAKGFGQALGRQYMYGKFNPEVRPRIHYAKYLSRWTLLRSMFLQRKGGGRLKPSVDAAFTNSFRDFVLKYCHARVAAVKGDPTISDQLSSMMTKVGSATRASTPRNKPRRDLSATRGSTSLQRRGAVRRPSGAGNSEGVVGERPHASFTATHRKFLAVRGGRSGGVNADAQLPHVRR